MKQILLVFLIFGTIGLVTIAGSCGGFPKVVDEVPTEEPPVLEEPQQPAQFVTQDSVFKFGKKCFRLVPGGGVLTIERVDCP